MKRHIALLIGFGIFALAVLGLRQLWSTITKVERGDQIANVDWLPNTASNVSFARTYNWQYYEFDICESEFVRWAKRWALSEIENPFYVTRFSVVDSPGSLYDGPREFVERHGILLPEKLPDYTAQITSGLCYHHYNEKNHGGVYVAFDRAEQRAYFHSAAR